MLAQKNEAIDECIYTMAQLSEDEKIRMQCEARKDSIAIEKGLYSRGLRQGIAQGRQEGAEQLLVDQITSKLETGCDITMIAKDLVQTKEHIEELIEKYHIKVG